MSIANQTHFIVVEETFSSAPIHEMLQIPKIQLKLKEV